MGALDNVKNFQVGGSSGESTSDSTAGPAVTMVKGEPTIKGPTLFTPKQTEELLANMQKQLDERTGFLPSLSRNLDLASAVTYGPSALREAEKHYAEEDQNLFKIRSEMATFQAAQDRARALQQLNRSIVNGGGGGSQVAGKGTTGGSGTTGGAFGFMTPESRATYNALNETDPTAAEAFRNKLTVSNQEKVDSFLNRAESFSQDIAVYDKDRGWELTKVPVAVYKQNTSRYSFDPPSQEDLNTSKESKEKPAPTKVSYNPEVANQKSNFQFSANSLIDNREGGYNAQDPITGMPVNMGIDQKAHKNIDVSKLNRPQALGIYKKEYWDAIGADSLNHAAATIAFDAAVNQGPEYAKKLIAETGGDPEKMIVRRAIDYKNLAESDPKYAKVYPAWIKRLSDVSKEAGIWGEKPSGENAKPEMIKTVANPNSPIAPTAAAMVNAPVTPQMTQVAYKGTGNRAQDIANLNAQTKGAEKQAESDVEVTTKERTTSSEAAGKREAALMDRVSNAREIEQDVNAIQNISKNKPQVMGLAKGLNPTSIAIHAASLIPGTDVKKADEMAADFLLNGPGEQEARGVAKGAGNRLGIMYGASVFKGSRLGVGLERMAADAKGVGPEYTAEANMINSEVIRNLAEFDKAKAQLWGEWKKTHGGKLASFDEFERSPEVDRLDNTYLQRMADKYPQYFKRTDKAVEEQDHPSNKAAEELERRRKAKEKQ